MMPNRGTLLIGQYDRDDSRTRLDFPIHSLQVFGNKRDALEERGQWRLLARTRKLRFRITLQARGIRCNSAAFTVWVLVVRRVSKPAATAEAR